MRRSRRRPVPNTKPHRPRVLVVYAASQWPLRTTIEDHLFALARASALETVYFNAQMRRFPKWLNGLGFDLIVFHTTFLAQRWDPPTFERLCHRVAQLKGWDALRVAMPQDEFLYTDLLSEFIEEFKVGHVLSCAPETEWPKIYRRVTDGVAIRQVLTGYLEPRTLARIESLQRNIGAKRSLDVGYRAWKAEAWLGRHGILKSTIAEAAREAAGDLGMSHDISLDPKDVLVGDAWFRFLLGSRSTIGVEGGASVLDHDGSVKRCVEEFVARHPDATFEQIEESCFAGRDGEIRFFALSPRHLEASATRTVQILVEGHYGGVLLPNVHYIPVKNDLSNMPAALALSRQEELRATITDRAYRDVVASGRYTSAALASVVADIAQTSIRPDLRPRFAGTFGPVLIAAARVTDSVSRRQLEHRPKVKVILARLGLLGLATAIWRRLRATDAEGTTRMERP